MRRISLIALAIAITFMAVAVAFAGIGPDRGLPNVDLTISPYSGDNNYYQVADNLVQQNYGSVMCVVCHTRNPGARTGYRVANGFMYAGSHFVTRTFAETNEGGGYTNAKNGLRAAGNAYMADNTGARLLSTNGWYGLPRYGILAGAGDIGADTSTPASAVSQMICESCHSVVNNIGPAKLLATGFSNGKAGVDNALGGTASTTSPALCVGCHADMNAAVNNEWRYHPLLGGATFGGTQHHRNTAAVAGASNIYSGGDYTAWNTLNGSHNMGTMQRSYYNQIVSGSTYQLWGAAYGELGSASRTLSFGVAVNKKLRDAPISDGQIVSSGTNVLLCTNCHRGHNADSSAGATVLMRNANTTTAIGPSADLTLAASTAWLGVRTMEGRGGRDSGLSNTNPHCLACHQ